MDGKDVEETWRRNGRVFWEHGGKRGRGPTIGVAGGRKEGREVRREGAEEGCPGSGVAREGGVDGRERRTERRVGSSSARGVVEGVEGAERGVAPERVGEEGHVVRTHAAAREPQHSERGVVPQQTRSLLGDCGL